jgi:O-methyltransferase
MWMKQPLVQRIVGQNRVLRRSAIGLLSALETAAMRGHKQREVMALIRGSRAGRESLLTANEHFTLFGIARAQGALAGDMAEFGVFEGSSATILATAAPHRVLHLFDTFMGLPQPGAGEQTVFRKGQFVTSLPRVRRRLAAHDNLAFHVGTFPASTAGLDHLRFSFVHLDVDLYDSTLAGLAYFYPRMVPGGIIVSHDFSILPGVERAFADYLADRPERPIELPSTQAMIVCRGGLGGAA